MDGAAGLAAVLGVTAAGGGGLAAFLLLRAGAAPGARPLAAFVAVVAAWAAGLLIRGSAGTALMALAPVGAAVFLHFAARLTGRGGALVMPGHVAGLLAGAAALAFGAGRFVPWGGVPLFRYDGAGLGAVAVAVTLAALGHGLLARAWLAARGRRRRQIGVVIAAAALGLGSVAGLALPILGIAAFPWPLLALPAYLAVLVYGVLRYELMAVNQWARRLLTWSLSSAAAAGVAALAAGFLAAEVPWPAIVSAVAAALALWSPLHRLVDRLVYPGGAVDAAQWAAWRAELAAADRPVEVHDRADALLRAHLRVPEADWADAPPGPRRVIDLMAGLREEALRDLERRRAFAEERRLAELGALAATVAHDLRNPMTIIALAVADAAPAVRQEVREQLRRMDALVRDLLDYAKPWSVVPAAVDVAAAVAEAAAACGMAVEIQAPSGLTVRADAARLAQALVNLLANARPVAGRVLVAAETAEAGAVLLHVCDDGPGIPADIRESLFQPFVSRGPGGTGLGLVIVAKVMAAHGGTAVLGNRPGWATCITLRFPP